MANITVFNYAAPFVESVSEQTVSHYLTEEERQYEDELRRVCFQFAVKHNLVTMDVKDKTLIQPSVIDVNSWVYTVNWTNLRSLVDPAQYQSVINRLLRSDANSNVVPMEVIIDLYTRIGCLFDHQFISVITNRVMTSIGLIPYTVDSSATPLSWRDIHTTAPWIWCLIYVQSLIRTETVK